MPKRIRRVEMDAHDLQRLSPVPESSDSASRAGTDGAGGGVNEGNDDLGRSPRARHADSPSASDDHDSASGSALDDTDSRSGTSSPGGAAWMQPLAHRRPRRQPEDGAGWRARARMNLSPLSWEGYFTARRIMEPGFCVYTVGELETARDATTPVLLLLHGGGHCALSWAMMVRHLRQLLPADELRIVAYDARGHGETRGVEPESDLSSRTQVEDAVQVLSGLFGDREHIPPVVVVGHSMGGAIAVHLAASGRLPQLHGLVVVDVVEGSALQALPYMQMFLASRRKEFRSRADAIAYVVQAGHIRNVESARCSVPTQIEEVPNEPSGKSRPGLSTAPWPQRRPSAVFRWRTPLENSELYWRNWFEGMSQRFLSVSAPKLLVLSGHDHLDRELTIAQMQGRFQTMVLPKAGHCVHEDLPDRLGAALADFLRRNAIVRSGQNQSLISQIAMQRRNTTAAAATKTTSS